MFETKNYVSLQLHFPNKKHYTLCKKRTKLFLRQKQ